MSTANRRHNKGERSFWCRYGQYLALVVLSGYLALLGTGVVAETFDIQWLLDWWIWRPPGR